MPLITVTALKPKGPSFKSAVLDSVHAALIAVVVPETDRFQRFLELAPEDFRFDAGYPDAQGARDENFVLIEVLWSVGRSVKVKRRFLDVLMEQIRDRDLDPENVMVVFKETTWENWAFAGGRQIHV